MFTSWTCVWKLYWCCWWNVSISINGMPICVQLCACLTMLLLTSVLVLFLLDKYSYQMPYKITGCETFAVCASLLLFFEVEPLTSTSIYPLSSSLICPHSPHLPFLMTVQSDPPLAQSWPITPHPNQEAGWRRWPASEGPLTRYQCEWQTSFVLGGQSHWTTFTYLSWILFTSAGP